MTDQTATRIGIVLGSTRPGRNGQARNFSEFVPNDHQVPALETLIDQVIAWSKALAPLRGTGAGHE